MLSNVPVVRAGDTLIVCVGGQVSQAEMSAFQAQIEAGLPGVRVAFFERVTGLAVFRPDESVAVEDGQSL